jgi:hypothetical protein
MDHLNLSTEERLNLKGLINQSDCENNTDQIRRLKHSVRIHNDVRRMEQIQKENAELMQSDPHAFSELCKNECSFLFNNYTEIFNKLFKDELDIHILAKLLVVLKMIEDEKIDQHEGSVMVGKVLKELYVDSAIKHANHLDDEHAKEAPVKVQSKAISWKQYKKTGTSMME